MLAKLKDPTVLFNLIDGDSRSPLLSLSSSVLGGLEDIYALGLKIYLSSEKVGLRCRLRVPVPVVSIGNLSVGGTGKTPAAITIALALQKLGLSIVMLSRGHGGSKSQHGAIVSDETKILLTTRESGDEPMLLAKALPGIPVLIGKDRRQTAATAISRFAPDLLLMDDGFQYWQLARDVDVVLLDASRPFGNGHCLPRGLLREPKGHIARAQVVIFTRSSNLSEEAKSRLIGKVQIMAPKASFYFSEHVASPYYSANALAHDLKTPTKVLAVCAIANPESFVATLKQSGIVPTVELFFSDHNPYSAKDYATIAKTFAESGADSIVVTQKDFVKVEEQLSNFPLFVQSVSFKIDNELGLITDLLRYTSLPRTILSSGSVPC